MRQTFLPWVELKKNKLNWEILSHYTIHMNILEQNRDKICWHDLSYNNDAITLLEKK